MPAATVAWVCLLAGALLRRSGRLPADAPAALNGYVIRKLCRRSPFFTCTGRR